MSYRRAIFEQNYHWHCLWNNSFFEVCMHLISNLTWKDTNFKASWGVAIEPFSIEPKETTMHSVLKKDVFQILEELMLYFIPIKAWVENLHTKNCVKNLMVIMPSYFRRAIKDKTWKSFGEEGLFSNIANI